MHCLFDPFSRGTGRGPKGDAFEIAEAYKRKKRQEMLREEDVIKAKNIAKIINEPDSKPATKKVKSRVRCMHVYTSCRESA